MAILNFSLPEKLSAIRLRARNGFINGLECDGAIAIIFSTAFWIGSRVISVVIQGFVDFHSFVELVDEKMIDIGISIR